MTTALGLNFPNRHLVTDDIPRMVATGATSYVVYIYDLNDLQYWFDRCVELLKVCAAEIHLRIEMRGPLDAKADAAILSRVAWKFGTLVASISIRNEPQIESPGISVGDWTAYLIQLGDLVKEPALPVRVFAAPMSPGTPDAKTWIKATALAAAGRFAGLWSHVYGESIVVQAWLSYTRSVWPGRLIVTEYNPGAGNPFSLGDWTAAIPRVLTLSQHYGVESVNLFTWEWNHPDMHLPTTVNVKNTAVETFLKNWRATVPTYPSPNHAGPRASTVGIVFHATLGPSSSPEQEYHSTINYFNDPTSQVSAHAIVGPGGKVSYPVDPNFTAWHCRDSNAHWLGLEMAKPLSMINQPIAPDILDAAAKVAAGWCVTYNIPIVWSTSHGLAEHHEMPTNIDGHRDVGGPFDRADFLSRVKAHTEAGMLTDQQKKLILDDLDVLWGMTWADTIKANPAESERACHERIVAVKVALGLQ